MKIMNYIECLINILKSLNDSSGLSENRGNKKIKDSESLELVFKEKLDQGGFHDLSNDFEIVKNIKNNIPRMGVLSNRFIKLPTHLFEGLEQKHNKQSKEKIKETANKILDLFDPINSAKNTFTYDVDQVLPSIPFYIYQPYGTQRSLDFIIVINRFIIFIECKTGEGEGGKFNDTIPILNTLMLFSNTIDNVKNPFTFFMMSDIMTQEAYDAYLHARKEHQEMKDFQEQTYNNLPQSVKDLFAKPNSRPILGLGKGNSNWFGSILGKSREQREEEVIKLLRTIPPQ